MNVLQTRSLNLVPTSPEEMRSRLECLPAAVRQHVSPDWLARARAATTADPWVLSYTMRLRTSGSPVGTCGFKGPAGWDGIVEIAYGVDAERRGNGYATEAAAAMVQFASAHPDVRLVRAHTLDKTTASAHVLSKCGFWSIVEVTDPDDGLVWRWEKVPSGIESVRPATLLAPAIGRQ